MENLNYSEIDNVGGGYLHLKDFETFSKFDINLFKGGILHTPRNAPMRKEKVFPSAPILRD